MDSMTIHDKTVGNATTDLDESDLVCNIQSVVVRREPNVCLLLPIGSNQGVDFGSLNIVKFFNGIFDLSLIRLYVNNKDEGVVLLDLLHRRLRVQWRDDGSELVHSWCMGNGFTRVLGIPTQAECLGTVECHRVSLLPC